MPSDHPSTSFSRIACVLLLVGAGLHATMILCAKPLLSANDRSRWCTVWSLVERQTYRIDEIRQIPGWDTIDLVYDGGHFYSTKPPILATWVAGIVWGLTHLTGWKLLNQTQAVTSVTLLLANGLPMLISWMAFARMVRESVNSLWGQVFLLSVCVFGTLLTPFAVTLNNHSVSAAGTMLAIYFLWQVLRAASPHWFPFIACGFAAAWTTAHELPAALLGIATFSLCLWRSPTKTLLGYLPAAAIPLGCFFLTNYLATGGFKPAYADYGTEKYRFVIDGVPSYWMEPKGVDLNVDAPPTYIFHCLFGHHGLFSLTPVWLMLIPAWVLVWKRPRGWNPVASEPITAATSHEKPTSSTPSVSPDDTRPLQILSVLSWLLTLAVLGFYFARTENYNYGGHSCGLRWAVWLTPFWLVALIPIVNRWSSSSTFRLVMAPLLLLSMFSAWSRVDNPWRQPWIFVWMEQQGWIDFSEPRPELPRKLWTWIAAVPDCRDGETRWMEFVNASPMRDACRMRLAAAAASPDNTSAVGLQITRQCGGADPEPVRSVTVDRTKMLAGSKPAEFLRWSDASVTPEQQQADLAFLRGLPLVKEFKPGVMRYRKTLLRTDAFRCQHALAQVEADAPTGDRKWRYRCDVWLCEELPFGIAEVEFQVHDVTTGLLLHQERWQAAACYPPPLPHAQWSPNP